MMRRFIIVLVTIAFWAPSVTGQSNGPDQAERLAGSLVYLQVSAYGYDEYYPWKRQDLAERTGYGCAVGEYDVLTTAGNVRDAAYIRVRVHGQNEFIPATVKVVDYESNLALLQLDSKEMSGPLTPLQFVDDYEKGGQVAYFWLTGQNRLRTGRGYIDRASVLKGGLSFARLLHYLVSSVSQPGGSGRLFARGENPIGLGAAYDDHKKEVTVIPAPVINHFLADAREQDYDGFPLLGFAAGQLLDPTMRTYLRMPDDVSDGVYVSDVFTLGSGAETVEPNDVILSIDGVSIDAFGRFGHDVYGEIAFSHLVTTRRVGEMMEFGVWRNGKYKNIKVQARSFQAQDMLVPYHQYDRQCEYVITGGFVLQKLARPYLAEWGGNWQGKVSAHLYHYERDMAMKPSDERREIVVLSQVLPAEMNLGYHNLRQLVVKKYNDRDVRRIDDIVAAQKANAEGKYDVIEFEGDNPVVVIPRAALAQADAMIAQRYGIDKLVNVE